MVSYCNAGSLWLAGKAQAALANCKLRLYQDGMGIVIGPTLTQTALDAAVATFTGYADITVAAMTAPLLNPIGGASISTGSRQFAMASPYTTSNVIAGGWIEDSTGALVMAFSFAQPISITGAGDGIPVEQVFLFGG